MGKYVQTYTPLRKSRITFTRSKLISYQNTRLPEVNRRYFDWGAIDTLGRKGSTLSEKLAELKRDDLDLSNQKNYRTLTASALGNHKHTLEFMNHFVGAIIRRIGGAKQSKNNYNSAEPWKCKAIRSQYTT